MSYTELRLKNLLEAKEVLEGMYAARTDDFRVLMLSRIERYANSGIPVDYIFKHKNKPDDVVVKELLIRSDGTSLSAPKKLMEHRLTTFWRKRDLILEKGASIIFYGPNANGKTHFGTYLLTLFIKAYPDMTCFFVRIKDFYAEYVKMQRGEQNFFNQYLRCKFLVIDELGKEDAKDNFIEFLENVLKTRSGNNLNTIICSNLKLDFSNDTNEFIRRYGMSCWSALTEKYTAFRFSGLVNQRIKNRVEW